MKKVVLALKKVKVKVTKSELEACKRISDGRKMMENFFNR